MRRLQSITALFLLAVILTLINPAQGATLTCNTHTPFIQVNPITRRTQYVRNVSAKNLTSSNKHLAAQGHFVGGTGGGTIGLSTDVRYEMKTLGSRGCMSIKSIRGTFYAQPVIHIASNFARGSCEYAAIMEHEQKHIRTMKYFHKRYAPKIKQELRSLAKHLQSRGPIPADRLQEQQKYVHNRITSHISTYSDQIMEKLKKRQALIDTPEEYARVTAKCTGWERGRINFPRK